MNNDRHRVVVVGSLATTAVSILLLVRWRKQCKKNDALLKLLEDQWEECTAERNQKDSSQIYRILTWNVLADAYSYGQRHCARSYLILAWRRRRLLEIIARTRADIICLQEADHPEWWIKELARMGYDASVAPRAAHCPDTAITAWLKRRLSGEGCIVRFDRCIKSNDALSMRFQRHNVGLIAIMTTRKNQKFVVSNAHLHWDPTRGDVKLAQMCALMQATEGAAAKLKLPSVVCGDLNCLPDSPPIQLALDGKASIAIEDYGKGLVLPFYENEKEEETYGEEDSRKDLGAQDQCTDKVAVDFNQNRLCRWLRLVGVDTLLETPEEAERRCHSGSIEFALRAKNEHRLLVTSSKLFAARRQVQNLPHILLPSSTSAEDAFTAVVRKTKLKIRHEAALTRCVRCNGNILECDSSQASELRKLDAQNKKIPHDPKVVLFECDTCKQVFWWSERDTSSAARAAKLAHKLTVLAAQTLDDMHHSDIHSQDEGIRSIETKNQTPWSHCAQEDNQNLGPTPTSSTILLRRLINGVSHNLGPLASVIQPSPFFVSNYVPNFYGQIDWIFYSRRHWRLLARRKLPTPGDLFSLLGPDTFLPCRAWPSDHIPIVADLDLHLPTAPVLQLGEGSAKEDDDCV